MARRRAERGAWHSRSCQLGLPYSLSITAPNASDLHLARMWFACLDDAASYSADVALPGPFQIGRCRCLGQGRTFGLDRVAPALALVACKHGNACHLEAAKNSQRCRKGMVAAQYIIGCSKHCPHWRGRWQICYALNGSPQQWRSLGPVAMACSVGAHQSGRHTLGICEPCS